jgi:hypothetical protein
LSSRLTNQEFPVLAQKVLEEVSHKCLFPIPVPNISNYFHFPGWFLTQVPEQLLQYMEQHHIKPNKK